LGTGGLADVPVAGNAATEVEAAGSGNVADTPEVAPLDAPTSGINTKSFDGLLAVGAGVAVAVVPTPTGLMVFFVPVVEASFAATVDDEAPREFEAPAVVDTLEEGAAAPLIGTPTGFEVPADIGPVRLTPAPA
jgi:hypothetical protein